MLRDREFLRDVALPYGTDIGMAYGMNLLTAGAGRFFSGSINRVLGTMADDVANIGRNAVPVGSALGQEGSRRTVQQVMRQMAQQYPKEFAEENPNTTKAVVKALIRAAIWLDENDNSTRPEAVEILSRPEYVGADYDVIANSMPGFFEFEKGDKRDIPDFNVFFRYNATYPFYSDAIW